MEPIPVKHAPDEYDDLNHFGSVCDGQVAPMAAYERNNELKRIVDQIEHVGRSFVLVGPSGVGKTLLLQNASFQLTTQSRQPWKIVQTSTSILVAGKKYIGEWQGVIRDLVQSAKRSQRVAIWFTDLMYLVGAGKVEGSDDNMASAMSSFMDRGEILLCGECTPETFTANLEPHPWFVRLLDIIRIEPQSPQTTLSVVERVVERASSELGQRHHCSFRWTHEAIERATHLGEIYFPGIAPPGGAVRLVHATHDDSLIGPLLESVVASGQTPGESIPISTEYVVQALSQATGAPRKMLDDTVPLKLEDVRNFFYSKLVGQRKAIDVIVELIAMIKAGLTDPNKPLGVLLFVGPTGVGKTELAKAFAEYVFGSVNRLIRLDMSEYQEYGAVEKLLGRPGASDPAGGLLARVRQNPFSLVLLDEIEKAHASVFDLLLQLLDAGRLTRASGETINFTQSVIILTSNLGATDQNQAGFGFAPLSASAEESTREAIQQFFRPELVNRIGQIVVFDSLSRDEVLSLASREIGSVLLRSGITRRKLQVDVDRGVIELVSRAGYDPRYGARPLKRAVERMILSPIAKCLAQLDMQHPPSLVQLYPMGDSVQLRAIENARVRRQQCVPVIRIADPIDGRKKEWDRTKVLQKIERLHESVNQLRHELERRGDSKRRTELIEACGSPKFWDSPSDAKVQLAELYRLERLYEAVHELENRIKDLVTRVEFARGRALVAAMESVASELEQHQRQAGLIHFAILCPSDLQRSDAFLILDAMADDSGKYVTRLAESYSNWAKRLGFQVTLAHEESFVSGELKQLIMKIEGAAVYGILAGEHGLHEFSAKSNARLVKVTVLPIFDQEPSSTDIAVCQTSCKSRASYLRSIKTKTFVEYRPTGQKVTISNGLEGIVADQCAIELLVSELYRQQSMTDADNRLLHSVVRRWWLGKDSHVRDLRTNVLIRRLKDVDAGLINPFLLAWLEIAKS